MFTFKTSITSAVMAFIFALAALLRCVFRQPFPDLDYAQAMRSPMQFILLCIALFAFVGHLQAQSLSWRQRLEPIGAHCRSFTWRGRRSGL